jgi:non-ribosomal peptide synthase protein (TIGR01720 family)
VQTFAPAASATARATHLLIDLWRELLGRDTLGADENFFDLGGDSILCLQVVARANEAQVPITLQQMFRHQTIRELVEALDLTGRPALARTSADAETGLVPLTPIQRWFFDQRFAEPDHWNQSVMLRVHPDDAETQDWRGHLSHLVMRHDALRMRFTCDGGIWQQERSAPLAHAFHLDTLDLRTLPANAQADAVERHATHLHRSLSLATGPLMRGALFILDRPADVRLLLVAHHLVLDVVSWRIILNELHALVQQAHRAEPAPLPPLPASWSDAAAAIDAQPADRDLSYWLHAPRAVAPLPVDDVDGVNDEGAVETMLVRLPAEETRALLEQVRTRTQARIEEVLLAAIARTLVTWTGRGGLWIDLEGHGRDVAGPELDLSRTVGWFTALYPVWLRADDDGAPLDLVAQVRDQLRAVPARGHAFSLARYAEAHPLQPALAALPAPDVRFNYLGRLDRVLPDAARLTPLNETPGPPRAARNHRPHAIEIDAYVQDDQLQVAWRFSPHRHHAGTRRTLTSTFARVLSEIRAACDTEAGIEDHYALTPMQEGLLVHARLHPDDRAYYCQAHALLTGDLDGPTFERAWALVVARHAILRTSFHAPVASAARQAVHRDARLPWTFADWRADTPAERDARLQACLEEDWRRPFDLTRPPLMRLALFQIAADAHHLVWTTHHLILDGWSLALLLDSVMTSYAALRAGQPPDLTPAPTLRPYIEWLDRRDRPASLAFWRRELGDLSRATPLPSDRGGAPATTDAGARDIDGLTSRVMSASRAERARRLARDMRVTLNTLLQGLWALLLAEAASQDEMLFGVIVHGRPPDLPDVARTMALFINTLPLRVPLPAGAPIADWLGALQQRQIDAQAHAYLPLADIQACSGVRHPHPLFECLVVCENYPIAQPADRPFAGLHLEDLVVRTGESFPLVLTIVPREPVMLQAAFDTARFEKADIDGLLEGFEPLLDALDTARVRTVGALRAVVARERQQRERTERESTHRRWADQLRVTRRQTMPLKGVES